MRIRRLLLLTLMACLLAGCLTQILVSATKEVMWRLLTPMIGFDPNETNLFEQPLIKDRMTAFLGPQYEPVVSLLKTADELQKEGPLFYMVSRYTPVPELAEQAGFVWNSDTNQMAVMLVTGGSPTIIAEKLIEQQVNAKAAELVPLNMNLQWPGELQSILDADALKKQAAESAGNAATNALMDAVQPSVAVPGAVAPAIQAPLPAAAPSTAVAAPTTPTQADLDAALEAELHAQESAEGK